MLNHREQLQAIRTFPQLVKYLRDELDWPISQDDFEDLTFEYSPEELGIDVKVAAKIQEIRRLRPLSVHQPWGIFFVKFEPKRLPVVAMRRMLNAVAIKNRASAVNADKITWASDDLLFISNYGDEENRQITFAHFTQNQIKKDLPTLKVLGWDNRDTALHLDHVAESLATYLTWPDDQNDTSAWRSSWRSAFTIRHREVIDTAKKLSIQLAVLARNIRERINTVLDYETENGPITKLMNAFKEALVHDLDHDGFADMYAQTIAYGLLSARIANPSGKTADDLASAMPVTNPFLKELMETFIDAGGSESKQKKSIRLDFDELGVSDVVELLDDANMEAVVRDFGDKNPLEDPVTHFYEQFFADYDNSERFKRGVFYTPRPVVSFIVKSVNERLRSEFGIKDGLADTITWGEITAQVDDLKVPDGISPEQPFVQILDPATGTGTFLVEVIHQIHTTMTQKWAAEGKSSTEIVDLWNEYVPRSLLPRLHGFELMMAPYAIAHMKVGLKLYETGYRFNSGERARIYLTNALEPAQDFDGTLAFAIPALAHEAEAVNKIKDSQRFTVIIGNPPYAGVSVNRSPASQRLVDRYRYVAGKRLEEVKLWLQNDYIKFISLVHNSIELSGTGVLGFITDNSYLDGPTFRGVRHGLAETFGAIDVLDLRGSTKRRDRTTDGAADENVFDIMQGVSIILCVSHPIYNEKKVQYTSLSGTRSEKYNCLLRREVNYERTPWSAPFYLFVKSDHSLQEEYNVGIRITDAFIVKGNGFMTGRDSFAVGFTESEVRTRISEFFDLEIPDDDIRKRYGISDYRAFKIGDVRRKQKFDPHRIVKASYRPFDHRWTYFQRPIIQEWQSGVHNHIFNRDNLALCVGRAGNVVGGTWDICFCTKMVTDLNQFYRGGNVSLPIYRYATADDLFSERSSNISTKMITAIKKALGLSHKDDTQSPYLMPEIVLQYAYGVFFSPSYRNRYSEFLKYDFPRLPLPGSLPLYEQLSSFGGRLLKLHLLEDGHDSNQRIKFNGTNRIITKAGWTEEGGGTIWLDAKGPAKSTKPGTSGFSPVSQEIWKFNIGGYQVCEKWLKDRQEKGGKNPRPGRVLTNEDIEHYQKIIVAISETIRVMAEIDEVIDAHGGWPGAFQSN